MTEIDLDIARLHAAYARGLDPADVMAAVFDRIAAAGDPGIFIALLERSDVAARVAALGAFDPAVRPLWGVPFAIKDNIDLAGVPTTAACPAYAYTPERSAFVVERLIAAGAIPLGKTNLDQFATGLVGTRSPYGAVRNSFDPAYISGGSSSGSAVAVARGLASFSLGTDTAGSGRVPAAFNNLIGVKPTRGLISARGVVPACRTLDSVSVFALDTADAAAVMAVSAKFDPEDAYARRAQVGSVARERFRFGVPAPLEFFGDADAERLFHAAVERLSRLGGEAVTLDFEPFLAAARLLYEGPWVAERYAAIADLITVQPEALHPVTRAIIAPAVEASAVAAFQAQYRLAELKRAADAALDGLDCVLTPTTGTIYTLAALAVDPIRLNSRLGHYTNFMNLLDYAAIAVPAGFGANGLPYGVTLFGPAFSDAALAVYAQRLHAALDLPLGATGLRRAPRTLPPSQAADEPTVRVVVCGAHLSGLALNHQLTERDGRLVRATHTAPRYRFYALPGGPPFRPGLIRQSSGGARIEVEVWELPSRHFGGFVAGIPAPLGIGRVELADGGWETGFICEGYAIDGARDITELGGWRAFVAAPD